MTQEVHEFPHCFLKKLRHQAKISMPVGPDKFHVWGWAKRQNTSRYTKVLWFAAHLCCKSYETLSPKKCRSHACICVNVYFYRSIRYCCELKLETASSASALTTATRCISQDGVHPANVETTQSSLNYSAPSLAHFDLTRQLLSYYHFI